MAPLETAVRAPIARRRFTRDEYHRMAAAGILRPDERVELLDGELIVMPAMGAPHEGCVTYLNSVFTIRLDGRAVIRPQLSAPLDERSEPEPDLALVRPPRPQYRERKPTPEETFLVVEVGASSAAFDREVKLPLYARAGIAEAWLVDLNAGAIEVCRGPGPDGYADVVVHGRGERVSPAAFPDCALAVDDVLDA